MASMGNKELHEIKKHIYFEVNFTEIFCMTDRNRLIHVFIIIIVIINIIIIVIILIWITAKDVNSSKLTNQYL